jgi:two-component sensor histidine kinase
MSIRSALPHAGEPAFPNIDFLLSAVFSGSGDCIKILDLDGHLQFMSEGGKRVMEVDDFDPLRGCPWPDLWKGEGHDKARHAVEAARRGESSRFEGRAETLKGTSKIWDVQVMPIAGPDGSPSHLLSISKDITEVREALAKQQILSGELQHRIKNSLAMVAAIASQTLRGDDIRDRRDNFLGRLRALARAHDLLTTQDWVGAPVTTVIEAALAPYRAGGHQVNIDGEPLQVNARQALALTLIAQELATNSVKYGALGQDAGRVEISWATIPAEDGALFRWTWQDRDGPPVVAPQVSGFGSRLLPRLVEADFRGSCRIEYAPTGIVFCIEAPVSELGT